MPQPTLLFYGHFDVQPAEPWALWSAPPFEPEIRNGRVYGRGASDAKGGVLSLIAAVEAMLATTEKLPVNVKVLFEGEEEIYGRKRYSTRLGGSVSAMTALLDTLGVHTVMLGFSHDDENSHAPDEFVRLNRFRTAQTVCARLLERGRGRRVDPPPSFKALDSRWSATTRGPHP